MLSSAHHHNLLLWLFNWLQTRLKVDGPPPLNTAAHDNRCQNHQLQKVLTPSSTAEITKSNRNIYRFQCWTRWWALWSLVFEVNPAFFLSCWPSFLNKMVSTNIHECFSWSIKNKEWIHKVFTSLDGGSLLDTSPILWICVQPSNCTLQAYSLFAKKHISLDDNSINKFMT